MKSKAISMLTLAALMLVSCNKDEINGNNPGPETGEESVVSLTIYDATMGTRAAGTNEDTPLPAESAINITDGIKVIVFNDNGTLAYPGSGDPLTLSLTETAPSSGIYKSEEFKILSGNKYFYIFANDNSGKITAPAATTDRDEFLEEVTAATLDATDLLNLTDPNFLMGTLWSEKKEAPRGGIPGAPKNVPLTIGRLVSKVTLNGVNKGTTSIMEGTFSSAAYRLGTIPKKIFLVGNYNESLDAPPAAGHGIVTSVVHDEAVYTGAGDPNFQQYTATWKAPAQYFYTVENTTAPDGTGTQYYGNTSYIQIRTVYTPHVDEISNVSDLTSKGSFTGPTFYTANLISKPAERRIFEDDPRPEAGLNVHADIDLTTVKVYTDGLNYHKFPIHDPEVGLPDVQKNTVLRNHSYLYTVTSIGDIGDPDPNVEPPTPIESQTTLTLEVTVAPWSKIENNSVPI